MDFTLKRWRLCAYSFLLVVPLRTIAVTRSTRAFKSNGFAM